MRLKLKSKVTTLHVHLARAGNYNASKQKEMEILPRNTTVKERSCLFSISLASTSPSSCLIVFFFFQQIAFSIYG